MTSLAEKTFLGTILNDNTFIKDTVISEHHLTAPQNKELYKAIRQIINSGKTADVITLSLVENLQKIGGMSYVNEVLSFANAEKFEEAESLILEKWKEIETKRVLNKAQVDNWKIENIVTELERIRQTQSNQKGISISESLVKFYEAPWEKKPLRKGVFSGIKALDEVTGGFHPGEVTIIAARPSMGKTDLMLHCAKQAGWLGNIPVIASLEMQEELLTLRMIASTGKYNRKKMDDPAKLLTEEQKQIWPAVIGRLSETNIQIFDQPAQTIAQIRANVRSVKNQFPDKQIVVFIDYLTLIRPTQAYGGNAHMQVTEISSDLKKMAKEFNVPVVCLAQLNRGVENRNDKRPMMSDIRESGSVEQDADVIIFLYREKYYNTESDDNTLELIIAKNRNGKRGTVKAKYNEFTGEIVDL